MASRKKLKTFTLTSEAPYDRHWYRINLRASDPIVVDSWDVARSIWFQGGSRCTTIEVLDK